MKKTILAVAGVAALAGIAMPMGGALAASDVTSHTDNLSVTIGDVCTLGGVTNGVTTGINATTHTNGDGDPALGTWDKPNASDSGATNTLSGTMIPGTADTDFGSSTFTIKCNSAKGYTLSAIGAGTADHKTELYSANVGTISTADGEPSNTTSTWAFKFSSDAKKSDTTSSIITTNYDGFKAIPASSTTVATQDHANDLGTGETIKVTYGVSVSTAQQAGTYTGAVLYSLAKAN